MRHATESEYELPWTKFIMIETGLLHIAMISHFKQSQPTRFSFQ